jgi:uracil-DNA glycosylase
MAALHRAGFANIATSRHPGDGLQLIDAYILSAVRCAPPDNKPLPEEITRCLDHLDAEVLQLPGIRVVVALGQIAFNAWLQLMKRRGAGISPKPRFAHGVVVSLGPAGDADGARPVLIGCYHPSRQNTNTGKLTPQMMADVFTQARAILDGERSNTNRAPGRPTQADC